VASPSPSPSENWRHRRALGRDEARGRVGRATAWVVAGAAGLSAVLVGVVAHEVPGHAAGATTVTPNNPAGPATGGSGTPTTSPATSSGSGSSTGGGGATASGGGFSPPPTTPAPTQQGPRVSSGQS
jgi:chemotaxis protein methyltransferase CheR